MARVLLDPAPVASNPWTWRRRCGRCKQPITGIRVEVEPYGLPPDGAFRRFEPGPRTITHEPCGHQWIRPVRRR